MKRKNCFKVLAALCLGFTLVCGWGNPVWATPQGAQVAIYNGTGVWTEGKTALESMLTWSGITYEEITASDLNSSTTNLSSLYKSIIIPGGNAAYYNGYFGGDFINATGKANIRDFVSNGGGYLGICAGAYFASDKIYYSADGGATYNTYDDADGYDLDLWSGTAAGPMNDIATYNPTTGVYNSNMVTLNFTLDNNFLSGYCSADILYYGGPFFSNYGTDTTTLATYEKATGLGNNSPAIVASIYGSGKVVLFGPHPEIEEDSSRDGTTYGDSLDDNDSEWKLMQDVLSYLGAGGPNAVTGGYSRYDFTYNYNDGSEDYYTGYVYAPTAFQTSGPLLTEGTYLYDQPMEMWASYKSFNGGAYCITGVTDGYDSSYDKMSYITSYYDANGAGASLSVNKDGSAILSYVNGHILVPNRTTAWEAGYAVSGSSYAAFSPYLGANVNTSAPSAALSSSALTATSPSASAAQAQALWAAYWSQTPSLLEEENYR